MCGVLVLRTHPPADQPTAELAQAAGGGMASITPRTMREVAIFLNPSSLFLFEQNPGRGGNPVHFDPFVGYIALAM